MEKTLAYRNSHTLIKKINEECIRERKQVQKNYRKSLHTRMAVSKNLLAKEDAVEEEEDLEARWA